MKSAAAVFLFALLTAGTAVSQVHIVEKAVISPAQLETVRSVGGISSHDIRYEFRWDTPYFARVYLEYSCKDTTVYDTGGVIIVDIPSAPAGLYAFEGQVGESYGQGPVMHVSYRLYQDDSMVDSASATLQPYSGCCWTVWPGLGNFFLHKTSYFSGFKLYLSPHGWPYFIAGNPSGSGGSAGIYLQGVYSCSHSTWASDSDEVTFGIISGSQFVSFDSSGVNIGAAATLKAGDLGRLSIVPGGHPPDSTGDRIVILAQSGTVTNRDSILLEPPYLDHFGAYFYPYAQEFDVIPVNLVPQNYFSHDITIPDTTLLEVSLDAAGAAYGNLYIGSQQVKSLSNITWDSLRTYRFGYVADGEEAAQPTDVNLSVSVPGSNTKPKEITLQVTPEPVIVTVTPSDLSPGDTAGITLKQRNADGSLTDFASGQQFEIGLWSGGENGAILLSDGTTGEYFSNVSQPFRFIAAGSTLGDSGVALIRVGTSPPIYGSAEKDSGAGVGKSMSASRAVAPKGVASQVSVVPVVEGGTPAVQADFPITSPNNFSWFDFGIGRVVVRQNYVLKIVNHAPWSIWPYLPPVRLWVPNPNGHGRKHVTETYPSSYNYKRGFTISVTDAAENPVPDAEVKITRAYLQGSGGHAHGNHGGNSLIPPDALQGTFYAQGAHGYSLTLTTDANGTAVVDSLVASQIAGTYLVTASLLSDPSVMDTVNLNVQVQGLVYFGDLIYLPNGEKPFILYQSDNGRANHPGNNYCTPAMGDSLFLGILDIYGWSGSEQGGSNPVKPSLNDMSLPWGGLFDIDDTWAPPHHWHRVGRSVDINNPGSIYQHPNPNDADLPVMTKLGLKLEK